MLYRTASDELKYTLKLQNTRAQSISTEVKLTSLTCFYSEPSRHGKSNRIFESIMHKTGLTYIVTKKKIETTINCIYPAT